MEQINFGVNKIKYLPESICNLRKLKNFIVSENNIKELPRNIGNLRMLDNFDISYNQISILPKSFYRLNSRTYVWFDANCYTEETKREIKRFFPNVEDQELDISPEENQVSIPKTPEISVNEKEGNKIFDILFFVAILIVIFIFIFLSGKLF